MRLWPPFAFWGPRSSTPPVQMSAVLLPAAISHSTATQVIFSNSTRSVFAHGAANAGAEGNARPARGACAVALPESAPARIVAKNVDIETSSSLENNFTSHFSAQNFSDLIPVHSGLVLTRAVTDDFFGHCFKRVRLIADVPGIGRHVLKSNLEIHIGLIR